MKNPAQFWKGSIGESAVSTFIPLPKYQLPDLTDPDSKRNVFEVIMEFIAENCPNEFMVGYIDLDSLWGLSKNKQIIEWKEQLKGYEKPFLQRYLYLFKLDFGVAMVKISDKESTNPKDYKGTTLTKNGKVLKKAYLWDGVEKKTPGSLKPINDDKSKWFMTGRVCMFHNPDLGWTKEMATPKPETVLLETGELIKVTPEDAKEEFRYTPISCFVSPLASAKILTMGEKYLKENPDLTTFYIFLVAGPIIKKEATDDFKEGWSLNIDDALNL